MKMKLVEVLFNLFSEKPPKTLALRYMELDSSIVPIIAAVVKKYPTIEIIDLEGNFINDLGAMMIADMIATNDGNLNELNLKSNKITADGA